jgi:hypothetical protein
MQRTILIDERPESYGSFFTDNFAELALNATTDVPALYEVAFDLVAEWRSMSYSAALPATIPSSLKSFHDGYTNQENPEAGILKFADAILQKVAQTTPELTSDPLLQKALHDQLIKTSTEITRINANLQIEMDANAVWNHYLTLHPFTLGLSGTLRIVFVSMYGAYENFIVRAMSAAYGGRRFNVTKRNQFEKAFRDAFGNLYENCWDNDNLRSYRLVRNAFVHAGGRVTPQLADVQIPVVEHENSLHVYPEHLRNLFDLLKRPALQLMEHEYFRSKP